MSRYGYSDADWQLAKKQATLVLRKKAAQRTNQTISYSGLAREIRAIQFGADEPAFHSLLGEISSDEEAENRGLLTVLVVHKGGDQMPGQGFFDLAESVDRDVSDKVACWVAEFERVLDANRP